MRSYFYLATTALAVSPLITAQSDNLEQRQDYSQQSMKMTFYGYPDNCDPTGCYSSPEGNYVAYDCQNPNGQSRGYKAGGDGTWNNPLSIAGELDQCSIIYIPYLRKYGIIDDRCYGCGTAHIDIWVESQCDDDFDNVCKGEFSLTPDQKQPVYYYIKSDQGSELPVITDPLYYKSKQTCSTKIYNSEITGDTMSQNLLRNSTFASKDLLGRQTCHSAYGCVCDTC